MKWTDWEKNKEMLSSRRKDRKTTMQKKGKARAAGMPHGRQLSSKRQGQQLHLAHKEI
jgi:hypothetical protein